MDHLEVAVMVAAALGFAAVSVLLSLGHLMW
jgi:hypothetical protein